MTARADTKAAEDLTVLADPAAVAEAAAQWLVERVGAGGAVCLSGGSTPRLLYERLALPPYRDRLPWPRLHWFWGDERFVAPDDPRSNYRMARLALFDHVPAPPANLHPIPTAGSIEDAAAAYERSLRDFAASRGGAPLFDASLLGLGPDGHTASLFPGTAALEEGKRWVRAVPDGLGEPRITLTFPALARSAEIAFLVDGAGKRDILARVRGGADLPAARVRAAGRTRWFVDRAALGTERR
jgi:6-phosphogluconolactonase